MALITMYWSVDFLIALGSLIILVYFYMTRNFNYWKKRGVTELKPTPFFGNFGECLKGKQNAGDWLQGLYNKSAGLPYMGFYIFDRPFFLARDPELIKNILVKDFNYFHDRFTATNSTDPLGEANLFWIKNPAWRYLRSKIRPIYTSEKLKKTFRLIIKVVDNLDIYFESFFRDADDHVIELKEVCAKYTTDIIGSTAYGLEVNSLNDSNAEFRKHGREIFNCTFYRNIVFTSIFLAPDIAKRFKFKFFSPENAAFLRTAVWSTMHERERSGVKRDDLIDLLLELKKTQARSEKELFDFAGDNIVAQAAVFFTAGFETSSSTLSFALYELALNRDVQSKARNEILNALKNKESDEGITYNMVMDLPYLDMVISETLRKYPSLPILDRVANQDYKVPNSDLTLKKGTPVYISVSGLHYDPQYFPNPQEYNPERFTLENKKTRPSGVYLPFGDGPHICIGLRFALLVVKLTLFKLLQKYEFSPCEQTLIPMRFSPNSLMLASDGGIFLNVRRITAER